MNDCTPRNAVTFPVSGESEPDRAHAMTLGISFDGTQYRYREFKYDRLRDALAYAALDAARGGAHPSMSDPAEWLDRRVPAASDEESMRQARITFEGGRYRYQDFRYDRLADAIQYARNQKKWP